MRTSPALLTLDRPLESTPSTAENTPVSIGEGIRSLVGIVNQSKTSKQAGLCELASSGEEVLVDTEVDGSRYLLVRMPVPDRNAIRLSPREQEIVRMVAKGHPNKIIADVLNISSWTVCTHLRRIFAKLGVGSRAAMVAQLLQMGTLKPDHQVERRAR